MITHIVILGIIEKKPTSVTNLIKICKVITEDFIPYKFSNIYAILNSLRKKKYIIRKPPSSKSKELFNFAITSKGKAFLKEGLEKLFLNPETPDNWIDIVFQFILSGDKKHIEKLISKRIENLNILSMKLSEKKEKIPVDLILTDKIIDVYNHRIMHIQTEIDWLNWIMSSISKEKV